VNVSEWVSEIPNVANDSPRSHEIEEMMPNRLFSTVPKRVYKQFTRQKYKEREMRYEWLSLIELRVEYELYYEVKRVWYLYLMATG
jgi:hypothetical protein